MAPQAPRAVRAPVTFKKQKDHHSGLCDLQSPISNLQSPASTHLRPDPVRSPISISNLQSPASYFAGSSLDLRSPSPISNLPISIRGAGGGGGLEPSRRCAMDSFTPHISDLRSQISHLRPLPPPSRDLQSPISISNLRPSGGCPARGSTICVLHLQSPPLTLATANTIHNL